MRSGRGHLQVLDRPIADPPVEDGLRLDFFGFDILHVRPGTGGLVVGQGALQHPGEVHARHTGGQVELVALFVDEPLEDLPGPASLREKMVQPEWRGVLPTVTRFDVGVDAVLELGPLKRAGLPELGDRVHLTAVALQALPGPAVVADFRQRKIPVVAGAPVLVDELLAGLSAGLKLGCLDRCALLLCRLALWGLHHAAPAIVLALRARSDSADGMITASGSA